MQYTNVRLKRHIQHVQGHVVRYKSVDQHGDCCALRAARAHFGNHVALDRRGCQRRKESTINQRQQQYEHVRTAKTHARGKQQHRTTTTTIFPSNHNRCPYI